MPGDRNSILYVQSHCVSFTFARGYCRILFKHFCILYSVLNLNVAEASQPSSNVAGEIQISQGPQSYQVLFRYCSPAKSGEAHPHLVTSLAQSFVLKLKLHSF